MDIKIQGGQVLSGEITPSGSKNSAVHILPATLLIEGKVTLYDIPEITDVEKLVNILTKLGSIIDWQKDNKIMQIDNSNLSFEKLTQGDLGNMRGTSLLWGALLARFKKVDFDKLPGGCTLGIRSLEPIYQAFRDLGVGIERTRSGVKMLLKNNNSGEIWLSEMSPTATTNLIMISSVIGGKTKIIGAASEPQVQDVCRFLIEAGVKIKGVGTNILEVESSDLAKEVSHTLLPDHYEIATFLAMGALTGGEVRVKNAIPEYFHIINKEFSKFNINITYEENTAIVKSNQDISITGNFHDKTNIIRAQPWPALPVDLLPIFIPLALASKKGYMIFHNWMYESGLFWTSELTKMGGEVIMCDPHRIIVMGGNVLYGAQIEAPYIIRAVVSLAMTSLVAQGETTILNADALYRGHPHFSRNLTKLGAEITEMSK